MIFVVDDWPEDHHDGYVMNESRSTIGSAAITRGWRHFGACTS
jgi:hypothetical protein